MLKKLASRPHRIYLAALIRESWAVSWPMTVMMFLQFLVGFCDVYVAGRFGKDVQAAYGLAFQTYFILSIMGSAISVGTVSLVSRLAMKKDQGECRNVVAAAVFLAAALGVLFLLIGYFGAPWISSIFNIPPQLRRHAAMLMRVYSLGLVFQYLMFTANAVLRSTGRIISSLVAVSVMAVLNFFLNFGLSFHTPLGFSGIAVATVISTGVAAAMCIWAMRGHLPGKADARTAWMIADIGWPAGVLQIVWQLGAMTIYYILSILPEHNVEIMAAFTNGTRIESLIFLPAFAFNMSNAVLVGNYIGKEEHRHAFWGGMVTALIGVSIVVFMTAVVLFKAPFIAGVLSADSLVVKESLTYIYIALLFEPVMAWGVILCGALNGAGDTRGVMKIVALSVWLVRIPLSYLLAIQLGWGVRAVWWSMNMSLIVQALFVTRRYWRRGWLGRQTSVRQCEQNLVQPQGL